MGFVIIGGTGFVSIGPAGSFSTLLCPKNVKNGIKITFRYTNREMVCIM